MMGGMDSTAWRVAAFFFLVGLYPLLTVFFPQLPIRWGNPRSMWPGYPMSIAGRLAFASFPMSTAFAILAGNGKLGPIGSAIMIPTFLFMMAMAMRDKLNFKDHNSQD
jgi:hypothetical protein